MGRLRLLADVRGRGLPPKVRDMIEAGAPLSELGARGLRLRRNLRARLLEVLEYRERAARLAEALPRCAR